MNISEIGQMFAATLEERRNALRDAIQAVENERLSGETNEPDDAVYNKAIDHAILAIRNLIPG